MTFERARQGPGGGEDNRGRIRVTVRMLAEHGKYLAGNITRSMTVKNAYVGEVAQLIEKTLFGEWHPPNRTERAKKEAAYLTEQKRKRGGYRAEEEETP